MNSGRSYLITAVLEISDKLQKLLRVYRFQFKIQDCAKPRLGKICKISFEFVRSYMFLRKTVNIGSKVSNLL